MKVICVMKNDVPVSLGVGRFCFELKDGKVQENDASKAGSEFNGKLREY